MRVFRPTRGTVVGALGVLLALGAGILFVANDLSVASVEVCLALWLFAWLIAVVLLWPQVRLGDREIWVVGSLRTAQLPAERIVSVSVRQYLEIDADGRRYTCAAIGHSRSTLARSHQQPVRGLEVGAGGRAVVASEAERLRELIEEMAAAASRRPRPDVPPVERLWNAVPLLVLAGLVAALAVTALIGALG